MQPPFMVGRIVRPPYFIDREVEVQRLTHALGSLSESQLVVALRRMGKSSLLANVQEEIGRRYAGVLTASVDCRNVTSAKDFVDNVARAVLTAYEARHPVKGWLRLQGRLLRDAVGELAPEVAQVGGSVGEFFTAYVSFREKRVDERELVKAAFEFLDRFSRNEVGGIVLILDEFRSSRNWKGSTFSPSSRVTAIASSASGSRSAAAA